MMKKILVVTALCLPACVIAEDIDGVVEPLWKDFAPPAFVNVEEPKGLGKLNETAAYWYKRKVEFDTAIEKCRTLESSDVRFTCYQDVKVKQYQKNSDYNAKIEAQENAKRMPQEMYDRTDNMLPIGGYLNNFTRFQPNEFR